VQSAEEGNTSEIQFTQLLGGKREFNQWKACGSYRLAYLLPHLKSTGPNINVIDIKGWDNQPVAN
jgi:hypothetical protein